MSNISRFQGAARKPTTTIGPEIAGTLGYTPTYKVQQATAEISSLQSQVSSLQSQVSTLKSQLSSAQSSLAALKSQNATLTSQLSGDTKTISSLKSQIATLTSQLSTANGTIASLRKQALSLTAQIGTLSSTITSLKSQLGVDATAISNLKAQVAKLTGQVSFYQSQMTTLGAEVTSVAGDIKSFSSAIGGAKAALSALSSDASGISPFLGNATSALGGTSGNLSSISGGLGTLGNFAQRINAAPTPSAALTGYTPFTVNFASNFKGLLTPSGYSTAEGAIKGAISALSGQISSASSSIGSASGIASKVVSDVSGVSNALSSASGAATAAGIESAKMQSTLGAKPPVQGVVTKPPVVTPTVIKSLTSPPSFSPQADFLIARTPGGGGVPPSGGSSTTPPSSGSSSSGGPTVTYEWSFGDGGSSTDTVLSYTYTLIGTFQPTLTITVVAAGVTHTRTFKLPLVYVRGRIPAKITVSGGGAQTSGTFTLKVLDASGTGVPDTRIIGRSTNVLGGTTGTTILTTDSSGVATVSYYGAGTAHFRSTRNPLVTTESGMALA